MGYEALREAKMLGSEEMRYGVCVTGYGLRGMGKGPVHESEAEFRREIVLGKHVGLPQY
jgi:hypothetical protein